VRKFPRRPFHYAGTIKKWGYTPWRPRYSRSIFVIQGRPYRASTQTKDKIMKTKYLTHTVLLISMAALTPAVLAQSDSTDKTNRTALEEKPPWNPAR
jgi:hypothetical protein